MTAETNGPPQSESDRKGPVETTGNFPTARFGAPRCSGCSRITFSLAILLTILLAQSIPRTSSAATLQSPRTILWAWHRSEDLSYIDPREFAVAYLACSVLLSGNEVRTNWRQQPLKVPERTILMPVVRVDTDPKQTPTLDSKMVRNLTGLIARIASRPRSSRIQVDFDARLSERDFYRQLLTEVRQTVPAQMPLSITALASWCLFDNWLANLPVSETVPMMFSLGTERTKVLNYFRSGKQFLHPGCCDALGVSLEDSEVNALMIPLSKQRKIPPRLYVFTRSAWTREKVETVRLLAGDP
ncbi:MAG: DUF3142 domain-containing protein [Candidatus Obscuribacterales bacterium]|nr:DUF3142 domain-containing protein [Candidatus Obscuribacterales bacterium]